MIVGYIEPFLLNFAADQTRLNYINRSVISKSIDQ